MRTREFSWSIWLHGDSSSPGWFDRGCGGYCPWLWLWLLLWLWLWLWLWLLLWLWLWCSGKPELGPSEELIIEPLLMLLLSRVLPALALLRYIEAEPEEGFEFCIENLDDSVLLEVETYELSLFGNWEICGLWL
ncbi:hypothetical protein WICPIJ_009322 [Wickerhamomyces pijperi]|uniref:Uncharacterized protein n=1 Tax=Wickerhamomyces pijperi TaxID=599730 RepID=A0A9P8TDM1_WICPI|nr:hypothetical protein WICPIJ_009322 [Wickerhamomyces pijperi]